MPPRKIKKMLGLNWMKERLVAAGHPVKMGSVGRNLLVLGPLQIAATTYQRLWDIEHVYGDRMSPGQGQAFAVITGVHLEPGHRQAQVVMSLESFTQIVEWLIKGDPGSFLRPVKRKGFE